MKIIFAETRHKGKIRLPASLVKKLPEKIGLFTTVQYIGQIDSMRAMLEKAGKQVLLHKTGHALYPGQVLGCSIERYAGSEAFVYVGDGLFHPKAIALRNDLPVFCYDPMTKKTSIVGEEEVKVLRRREKAGLAVFHSSEKIGVLITTKPGQNRPDAWLLPKKYPGKKFYFFATDTLDHDQLENFPFIRCFVKTACPRIALDDKVPRPIVNIDAL